MERHSIIRKGQQKSVFFYKHLADFTVMIWKQFTGELNAF